MKKALMLSAGLCAVVFLVLPGTFIRSVMASPSAEPIASQQPSRAAVSVGGRVLCSSDPGGRGHSGATVILLDTQGNMRTTRTNPFGYYRFTEVQVGEMYLVSVTDKRLSFEPQVIGLMEELSDLNFVALP